MKTRILFLALMTISMAGFSQKAELKAAEKAIKSGDFASAKVTLDAAASLIEGAEPKMQAQYHLAKGNTYYNLAKKGDAPAFKTAIAAYNEVIRIEEAAGKGKYKVQAQQQLGTLTSDLVNAAVADNNAKNFKEAADKLYLGYSLSKQDTIFLYYAASSAVNGKDYESALKYYNELKEVGYDGSTVKYTAVNVETGEREEMDKFQRDIVIKGGTYKDPKDEKTESKKSEIVKNIALIYTQLGDDDKALQAYKDARLDDPNDVNLVLNEANLYYKLGDKEKFKALMSQATEMAPDNPDLQYNIGVINMEQGNLEEARTAYKKALEINPNYINALLNLSTTYVNEGNGLIDQLNELGIIFNYGNTSYKRRSIID